MGIQLKDSINELCNKRDQNFVKQLIVPLLNSEALTPVCFHFYDPINEKMIDQARKILLYMKMNSLKKNKTEE
jgi:hypothetical protein